MMRVSPLLEWDYHHIWRFLREAKLPYCSLYDQGYTSLGSVSTSRPNPSLLVRNDPEAAPARLPDGTVVKPGEYLPAYLLDNNSLERAGRVRRRKHREAPADPRGSTAASAASAAGRSTDGIAVPQSTSVGQADSQASNKNVETVPGDTETE